MVDNTIALRVNNPDIMNSFSQGRADAINATNAKREQAMQVMQQIGAVSLGAMGGNLNGQVDPQKFEEGLNILEGMGLPVKGFRGRPDMAPLAARSSLTAIQQLQLAQSERELQLTLEKFDASMAQQQRQNDIADRSYNLQRERLDYLKGKGEGAQSSLGKLKKDLDAGLIDKPTYDAAVKKATSESGGITVSPDGTVTIGNQLGKLTEGQSKDVNFLKRGLSAIRTLKKLEGSLTSLTDSTLSRVPLGNYMVSDEYQQAQQAAREFLAVILRKDTGAAVTDSEMELYTPMFLPVPGDSKATLEQKRVARKRFVEALREGLGSKGEAYPPIDDEGEPDDEIERALLPDVQDDDPRNMTPEQRRQRLEELERELEAIDNGQ